VIFAVTAVGLARLQFATTSIYHFLFVPLTLGLGPLVAVMQTMWLRTRNDAWLRLTEFFGRLFLINFAIGVATGLVQEFQFGMDWSEYSKFVGQVFGAPLAIEGLAAFFLEATFLGVWIFGRNILSPRVHLATLWIAVLGTWLSTYFILVANSWMQHPVGSKVVNGEAQLTSVSALLSNSFAVWAVAHTLLVGLTAGSFFVFGVSCWQIARGHSVELFHRSAMLALIVLVPVSIANLPVGSRFGIETTKAQPMKIAAAEALWNTQQPASFSLFQIGGFTQSDQTPSFSLDVPKLLSYLSTGTLDGKVVGLNELQKSEQRQYGRGNYLPHVRTIYWSMRIMAYIGALMALIAVVGAYLYRRHKLEHARWYLWTAVVGMFLPFVAAASGWVLTEVGRQPWIVVGLLKTNQANSPSVSAWTIWTSLAVFVTLYVVLFIVDIWLMRRYAGIDLDAPDTRAPGDAGKLSAAMGY
jgi:cytochrome bd ubiquinol oxidase subunit I